MPGYSGATVVTTLVCFLHFAREAAGAAGTRHFLRPLFSWADGLQNDSDASRRENAEPYPFGCSKIETDNYVTRRHVLPKSRVTRLITSRSQACPGWLSSRRSQIMAASIGLGDRNNGRKTRG
jgi:hypothetical protein